jgi:transposase-like protein
MTKPIVRDPIYRRRRFDAEIIEVCVRWYITYRLSYRDLVAMMAERGIVVSHTTIHRWVIRYVPEFEKRWNRFARPVNTSWRVDETYINIRGKWSYLYRAVDKHGKTVDFLLRPDRGIAVAQAFFRKALSTTLPRRPRKITLDGHLQSRMALRKLRTDLALGLDSPRRLDGRKLRVRVLGVVGRQTHMLTIGNGQDRARQLIGFIGHGISPLRWSNFSLA